MGPSGLVPLLLFPSFLPISSVIDDGMARLVKTSGGYHLPTGVLLSYATGKGGVSEGSQVTHGADEDESVLVAKGCKYNLQVHLNETIRPRVCCWENNVKTMSRTESTKPSPSLSRPPTLFLHHMRGISNLALHERSPPANTARGFSLSTVQVLVLSRNLPPKIQSTQMARVVGSGGGARPFMMPILGVAPGCAVAAPVE
ncbi:hypothetical protein EI94DRAFT_1700134 [Lactarius quietus]|nr:hypothetical protein EI94DRAFT_1700134 [Lactarius quietus]